jgi:hypothetical protein
MDYFYFAIGGLVIYTAPFKRKLLIQKGSFRIILVVSVILFLVGLVDVSLYFMGMGRYFVSGALLCPLITLAQYRLSHKVFLKHVKREPKDTSFVWVGKDLGKDRLFNLLYFIPAFWILIFITGGVERLAKVSLVSN